MDKKAIHSRIHMYLAVLIAFGLPLARLVPIFIVLLFLNWLIEADFSNKFRQLFSNKLALVFIAIYVLHLIGLGYTSNMDAGGFDVQVKLSLFVFPLIMASRPTDATGRAKIFYAFISGAVLSSLIMLGRALFLYFTTGENNFYYQAFSSFILHPSYMSMYLNLAILWLLVDGVKEENKVVKNQKIIAYILVVYFIFIIVLLSSKMGLVSLAFVFGGLLIRFIVLKKKYILGISGLLTLIVSGWMIYRFVPEIRERVNTAIRVANSDTIDKADAESTAVRLLVWKAADNVIAQNFWIGTGTGDSKDELMKEYQRQGMTGAYEKQLNAHNEFYQIFVSIGFIGFFLFLLSLFFPLLWSVRQKDTIYFLFIFILILNFLTESMFETQAGVMFYAFFNSLLCFKNNNTNKK